MPLIPSDKRDRHRVLDRLLDLIGNPETWRFLIEAGWTILQFLMEFAAEAAAILLELLSGL